MSKQKNFKNFLIAFTPLWVFAINDGRDSLDIVPGRNFVLYKNLCCFFMAIFFIIAKKAGRCKND